MNHKYILDENSQPILVEDILKWAQWFETAERHVGNTVVGVVRISTVFLGLDHAFGGGRPLLWETMIFGGEHDEYQERYSSLDDAKTGHDNAIKMVQESEAVL